MSNLQLLQVGVGFSIILYGGYWIYLKTKLAKLKKMTEGK